MAISAINPNDPIAYHKGKMVRCHNISPIILRALQQFSETRDKEIRVVLESGEKADIPLSDLEIPLELPAHL